MLGSYQMAFRLAAGLLPCRALSISVMSLHDMVSLHNTMRPLANQATCILGWRTPDYVCTHCAVTCYSCIDRVRDPGTRIVWLMLRALVWTGDCNCQHALAIFGPAHVHKSDNVQIHNSAHCHHPLTTKPHETNLRQEHQADIYIVPAADGSGML